VCVCVCVCMCACVHVIEHVRVRASKDVHPRTCEKRTMEFTSISSFVVNEMLKHSEGSVLHMRARSSADDS